MYDLKIPLGMMSEILIVRNRLKKDVEKEHITQNQAERTKIQRIQDVI